MKIHPYDPNLQYRAQKDPRNYSPNLALKLFLAGIALLTGCAQNGDYKLCEIPEMGAESYAEFERMKAGTLRFKGHLGQLSNPTDVSQSEVERTIDEILESRL